MPKGSPKEKDLGKDNLHMYHLYYNEVIRSTRFWYRIATYMNLQYIAYDIAQIKLRYMILFKN
jgi:hypothetical protein